MSTFSISVSGIRVDYGFSYTYDETIDERLEQALYHYGAARLEDEVEAALEEEIAALDAKAAAAARTILETWARSLEKGGE
jgi:hypothetical protein